MTAKSVDVDRLVRNVEERRDASRSQDRDESVGMSLDIDAALAKHEKRFKVLSMNYPVDANEERGGEILEVEWTTDAEQPNLQLLGEDMYALIGGFAEATVAVDRLLSDHRSSTSC